MHVEDHADFRDLMRILLNSQSDMEVVTQAGSLDEARAQVATRNRRGGPGPEPPRRKRVGPDPRPAPGQPRCGNTSPEREPGPAGSEKAAGTGADEFRDKPAPVEVVLESVRKLGVKT